MAVVAAALAEGLRGAGLEVAMAGSDLLVVSGPGLRAREFGAPGQPPAPLVAPVVAALGGRADG